MKSAMVALRLTLVCVSLSAICVMGYIPSGACYSHSHLEKQVAEMKKLASGTSLSKKAVNCLADYAMNMPMETVTVGAWDEKVVCLPQSELVQKMSEHGIPLCIPDTKKETTRMATVRVPRTPDTMASKVADVFGVQLTTVMRGVCDCFSGCHFCCLQEALSGASRCFQLWCSSGWGTCR